LGGALALQNGSSMVWAGATVTGNAALGGNAVNQAGGGFGGGVMLDTSSLALTDGVIANNLAQGGTGRNEAAGSIGQGGGAADGGGLMVFDSNLSLDRVSVTGNRARGGPSTTAATTGFFGPPAGGGLFLVGFDATAHAAVLVNTLVADNRI